MTTFPGAVLATCSDSDDDDDDEALYGGLSREAAPQLASSIELRTQLEAATSERIGRARAERVASDGGPRQDAAVETPATITSRRLNIRFKDEDLPLGDPPKLGCLMERFRTVPTLQRQALLGLSAAVATTAWPDLPLASSAIGAARLAIGERRGSAP